MNKPLHITDDRLFDLASRLLTTDEEQTIVSHLEDCLECESRFRHLLSDRETARSVPVSSARADGKGVIALPRRSPLRLGAIALIAAAAVIVVAIVYVRTHDNQREPYWVPIELNSTQMRSADSVAAGSSAAFHAYERHNAKQTIELLTNAPLTDDEMIASVQRLMLASAYVNDGQPKEALYVLEKLEIFSLPVRWREQAQWVEYMALRDTGDKDAAHERLVKISQYESEIGTRARAALED